MARQDLAGQGSASRSNAGQYRAGQGIAQRNAERKNMKPQSVAFDVEIQGIAPLLQNNIEGAEEQMTRKGKRSTSGVRDIPDEWKGKLYRIERDGKLGHPSAAIESALVKAARDFKADKRRSMADVVKALVYVDGQYVELVGKKEPDRINRASCVNPNTKGRGFVYRPQFDEGWTGKFVLTCSDTEVIDIARLKEILDYAGYRVGIGDWRPKFGRFIVSKFKERK